MQEINKDLQELLENKRVCIVGPSAYLMDRNLGSLIDSYDTVCRVNELIPLDCEEHYGSKTDIMFHALHPETIVDLKNVITKAYDVFQNMKMIVVTWVPNQMDMNRWNKTIEQLYEDYFYGFEEKKRYLISNQYHSFLLSKLNNHMNAGIASLSILSNYNFKELFITGFTFYHEYSKFGGEIGKYYYPKRKIESQMRYKKGCDLYGTWNPLESHDQNIQKNYFINDILRNNENKIMIDSHLKEILSFDYSNVYQLKEKK